MIREDIQQLKTGVRELRKFAYAVGGVVFLLGTLAWLRGRGYHPWLLASGGTLIAFGFALPRALKPVYLVWMSVAITLGFVVSTVILTLFFFLVITPVGWLARLAGKDFLSRKSSRETATYWVRRRPAPKAPTEYEKQF